jgi:hypothetical protein
MSDGFFCVSLPPSFVSLPKQNVLIGRGQMPFLNSISLQQQQKKCRSLPVRRTAYRVRVRRVVTARQRRCFASTSTAHCKSTSQKVRSDISPANNFDMTMPIGCNCNCRWRCVGSGYHEEKKTCFTVVLLYRVMESVVCRQRQRNNQRVLRSISQGNVKCAQQIIIT